MISWRGTPTISERQRAMQDYFAKRVKCYAAAYSRTRATGLRNTIFRLGWFPLRLIFKHTMQYLVEVKPQSVLDIGCGCGIYAAELASRGAAVTALDNCKGMIDATESLLDQSALRGRVRTVLADYLDWSRGIEKEYHLVLAIGLLDYVDDAREYLASFARVAREVIMTFPAASPLSFAAHISYRQQGIRGYFYTRRQIESLLGSTGLEIIRLRRLFPCTYWVHARRAPGVVTMSGIVSDG